MSRSGRGRRLTIGPFPTLLPDEARKQAKDVLTKARLGQDAALDRDEARKAETVADLWKSGSPRAPPGTGEPSNRRGKDTSEHRRRMGRGDRRSGSARG
jgi:hypothetical protein